ncbi:uncharacterized protein [Littorina saxatilis]|uniref:uncharacterized protein n=1 Tax=Littorina saxatilis TaxID=31220 RepID=UPI0038B4E99D
MAIVNLGTVVVLLLVSMKQAETAENNGCFTFPGLPTSLNLTAVENETITIPFELRRNSVGFANGEEPKSIYISRPTKTDFCVLSVDTAGICRALHNEDHCQCPGDGNPNFLFTTTVTQDDHGTWTWRVGNDQSRWTEVIIEVQQNGVENTESTLSNNDSNGATKEGSDEESFPGGLATFGGVFVGVNVVTVIVVATIVYVLRGRRERKRRNRDSDLPPPAKTTAGRETSQQAEPVAMDTPTDCYIPGIPESRNYEQTAATFGSVGNNDYENAVFKGRQQVTNSGYGMVF